MSLRTAGSLATLIAVLLTACTAGEADKDPPRGSSSSAGPVPELAREWEMTSLSTIPVRWNEHYWAADGWYANPMAGPSSLQMFDSQSGEPLVLDLDGYACGVPSLRPGDTHFVVATSDTAPIDDYNTLKAQYHGQVSPARECTGFAVYDASTGEKAWERPVGTARPIRRTTVNGTVVLVSYPRGEDGCFDKEDGSRLSVLSNKDCYGNLERRPLLLDEYGAPLKRLGDQKEIAQTDGMTLVSGYLPDGSILIRAHDLETGLALWADEADPDPTNDPAWHRTETYAATSDSLLHIRYEFDEQEGEDSLPVPTFAFISRVDPRTGEELGPVGKVAGGLFLAQIGDMAVMGVDQEDGLDAQLAGFQIPPVD